MPLQSFGCSICGQQAPTKLRRHDQFANRMTWLRRHRMVRHPAAFRASVKKSVRTKRGR